MDTSELYIRMCNKAKEIQDEWDVKDGDYFQYFGEGGKSFTDIAVDNFGTEYREIAPEAPFRDEPSKGFWEFDGGYEWDDELVCLKKDAVFLPRQDQSQEILSDNRTLTMLISDFHWWVGTSNRKEGKAKDWIECIYDESIVDIKKINAASMEQLWLKYVMVVKHSKRWDGKDWIKP